MIFAQKDFEIEDVLSKPLIAHLSTVEDGIPRDSPVWFLWHVKGSLPDRKISRTGVYGIAKEKGKILLVIQKSGPFAGLFDLPGGGIEFGEDPIRALHREFIEETGMDFSSMNQIDNFSAMTRVSALNGKPGYEFHQIGLIYSVEGLHDLEGCQKGSLKYEWVDIRVLKKDAVSPFVWAIIQGENACTK